MQQNIPHFEHRVWYSLHDCEIEIVGFYSKLLVMEYPSKHIFDNLNLIPNNKSNI